MIATLSASRLALLAHCVSFGVNALYERPNPYSGNGISQHGLDRRMAEAERLADAGVIEITLLGQTVTLTGWAHRRRDHGGVIFVDLRDSTGIAQVVFRNEDVADAAHRLRSEYCILVTGTVETRPAGSENPNLPSGAIEVNVTELTVLNESAPLPFQLDEEPGEEARLKYRYLDLRRPAAASALRLRSDVYKAIRDVLHAEDFTEVETPTGHRHRSSAPASPVRLKTFPRLDIVMAA